MGGAARAGGEKRVSVSAVVPGRVELPTSEDCAFQLRSSILGALRLTPVGGAARAGGEKRVSVSAVVPGRVELPTSTLSV